VLSKCPLNYARRQELLHPTLCCGVYKNMSTPSPQEIIYAYRNLYRGLLHAVQYSKPARYIARDQLRKAFRKEHPSSFNQEKVDKTVEFLRLAAREKGLEHRIVRNLLHTVYWEKYGHIKYALQEELSEADANSIYRSSAVKTPMQKQIKGTARMHYQMTLAMLNDSMGLCLR
jgi:hypothetical protein